MVKGSPIIGIDPKRDRPANPWSALATWFFGLLGLYTNEPTGFVNRTDSVISWANSATGGTLTIQEAVAGTPWVVFVQGNKYVKTTLATCNGTDVEGLHYFYYSALGVLTHTVTWSDTLITSLALVAIVYWDATNNVATLFCDERHGIQMDGASHLYEHVLEGMRYRSGLSFNAFSADGTGNDAANAQFGVTTGVVVDEDNEFTVAPRTPAANIRVFWREGVGGGWKMRAADAYPMIYNGDSSPYAGALVPWNQNVAGTWQLTSTTDGRYLLVHVFANNALTLAGAEDSLMAVMGQAEYINITTARAGAAAELINLKTDGLPVPEMVPLGTVILQVNAAYGNVPKARVRTTDLGVNYISWRGQNLIAQSSAASDHAALDNLDWEDESGHVGAPYLIAAFSDAGKATSVRGGLENVLYVDKGVNTVRDGSQAFPFHTLAEGLAAMGDGDVLLVGPGTYAETGLTLPAVGVYHIRSMDTCRGVQGLVAAAAVLNAGVGTLAITVAANQGLTVEGLTIVGRTEVSGSTSKLRLQDVNYGGQIKLNAGTDANTVVCLVNTSITGDATDTSAIYLNDADPTVFVFDSYVCGAAGGFAVYWNNVANNNLYAVQSCLRETGGGTPFGRAGAVTPTTKVMQCRGQVDPIGAVFSNAIGTPYNVWDADVVT